MYRLTGCGVHLSRLWWFELVETDILPTILPPHCLHTEASFMGLRHQLCWSNYGAWGSFGSPEQEKSLRRLFLRVRWSLTVEWQCVTRNDIPIRGLDHQVRRRRGTDWDYCNKKVSYEYLVFWERMCAKSKIRDRNVNILIEIQHKKCKALLGGVVWFSG